MMKKFNLYRDYYKLPFTKIYWSKLMPLNIKKINDIEVYRCKCCDKHPTQCNNKASAKEYQKIQDFIEKESDYFVMSDIEFPIYDTGWIRVDLAGYKTASVIWKIQRELANKAGFKLLRTPFM